MYHNCIITNSFRSGLSRELAERVKYARAGKLLTQAELAKAADLSRPTIARIESGRWEPRMNTVTAIAAALGLTANDLMSDPGGMWADEPS